MWLASGVGANLAWQRSHSVLILTLHLALHLGLGHPRRRSGNSVDDADGRSFQPVHVGHSGLDVMLELTVDQCWVFGVVELQGFQRAVGQIVHGKAAVTRDHEGQAVSHRGGLLVVFHHIAAAVGGGQIGATLEIVMANVHVVGSQQITQIDHACAGIRGVLAVRVAVDQLGEVVERVTCCTRIATGHVERQETLKNALVTGKGCEAANVVGIVNVRVGRVQTDETVGGRRGSLRLVILIVGVDQFQLSLLGVAAERIASLKGAQGFDCGTEVFCVQIGLGLAIQLRLAERLVNHRCVRRARGQQCQYSDQQQMFHRHIMTSEWLACAVSSAAVLL